MKFKRNEKLRKKKQIALEFLKKNKSVKSVLEKVGKFSGRLRTQRAKWLAGEKTKEAIYKENGCVFRLNVEKCYFSPRLSGERKEIAEGVKIGERVLVMFSGVAPFPIIIGRIGKADRIVGVELSRECNKYALENVRRNKLLEKVEIVQGDVRRVIGKRRKIAERFDRIVMPRPNLKDSFLDVAFEVIKKKGIIHYYGFCREGEEEKLKKLIYEEARKVKKKVRILRIKRAGDVGVREYRYRVDFIVTN